MSGLSYCKHQDTKTMGSAEGKLSTGHLAGVWSFVGVLLLLQSTINTHLKGHVHINAVGDVWVLISAPSPHFPREWGEKRYPGQEPQGMASHISAREGLRW